MSKMTKNPSDKNSAFVKKLDALMSLPDEHDNSALEAELRTCGVDPAELRKTAYSRIRSIAMQQYTSLGKNPPQSMREALAQLRPATPEEEEQTKAAQALSKVQSILANIKSGAGSLLGNPGVSLAPPFRNKQGDLTQADRELLDAQQIEIDSEGDQKREEND